MEKLTDWLELWAQLSDLQNRAFSRNTHQKEDDFWKKKAKDYDRMVDKRWSKPDSSRDFLAAKLIENPGASLLDVGAGTGKWSIFASEYAAQVTAFDPSAAMQAVLKERIQQDGITNIDIVTGTWPEDSAEAHDFVLASHSMYGVPDFKGFVEKMNQTAQKGCIMVLRVPFLDSIMATASQKILGQPHDSPNFQIAYNALLGMDIYPDVIMEADDAWPGWTSDSFEAALDDVKNRLGVSSRSRFDDFLTDLLNRHLTREKDKVVWPPGNRSALVYWEV